MANVLWYVCYRLEPWTSSTVFWSADWSYWFWTDNCLSQCWRQYEGHQASTPHTGLSWGWCGWKAWNRWPRATLLSSSWRNQTPAFAPAFIIIKHLGNSQQIWCAKTRPKVRKQVPKSPTPKLTHYPIEFIILAKRTYVNETKYIC